MDTFEITIGADQRRLNMVPQGNSDTYKIFAADPNEAWLNADAADPDSLPIDGFLGTITIRSAKDFTFDGPGTFSGDELLGIAAQVVIHSTPDQSTQAS